MLMHWLQRHDGVVAQAVRVMLASPAYKLDVACLDDEEPILTLLHGREFDDTTSCRPDGLALAKLAVHVAALLQHEVPTPELLRDEIVAFVESLGIELTDSGCPHSAPQQSAQCDPLSEAAEILDAKLEGAPTADMFEGAPQDEVGDGTVADPMEMPRRSRLPISEFKSKGYMTLAFPTLFPNGRGHFDEARDHVLKWEAWSQHLMKYHDGRFAAHRRFPHFMLNTHERHVAIQKAGIFVKRDEQAGCLTYGQLRALGT